MKAILFILTLGLSVFTYGQGIEYDYDPAGNRTLRKVFVLSGNGNNRLAGSQEELKEEITADNELTIYPNPVKETVNLKLTGEFEVYHLSIVDLTGKEVLTTTISEASKQLKLSHLPKGIYILRTTLKQEFAEWKMIKQ